MEEGDVRLVGLTRRFGATVAVDDVSLDVPRGEFFTLLGPSGSGEATTLRLIAGFELPDAGRVELAGVDVTRRPPHARDVNTVFQDSALFPHMSVRDNVEYGMRIRRVARDERRRRAEEALAIVRLEDLRARKPAQLSGGEVGMAFALSFDEVIVTTFTAGQDETLPIWILANLSRPREPPIVSVVAVLAILLSPIPVWIAQRITADPVSGEAGA